VHSALHLAITSDCPLAALGYMHIDLLDSFLAWMPMHIIASRIDHLINQ
jgi:hypothetical protein